MMTINVHYCFIFFCTVLGLAKLKPINDDSSIASENDILGESKAGISDLLKPQNWNSGNKETNNGGLQNPFQNLLNRTQLQDGILKDVKLFFLTVQGALMPASVISGGFGNMLQGLGNMGNLFGNLGQSVQNLNPVN